MGEDGWGGVNRIKWKKVYELAGLFGKRAKNSLNCREKVGICSFCTGVEISRSKLCKLPMDLAPAAWLHTQSIRIGEVNIIYKGGQPLPKNRKMAGKTPKKRSLHRDSLQNNVNIIYQRDILILERKMDGFGRGNPGLV